MSLLFKSLPNHMGLLVLNLLKPCVDCSINVLKPWVCVFIAFLQDMCVFSLLSNTRVFCVVLKHLTSYTSISSVHLTFLNMCLVLTPLSNLMCLFALNFLKACAHFVSNFLNTWVWFYIAFYKPVSSF